MFSISLLARPSQNVPHEQEQREIVDYIISKTEVIEHVIGRTEREIELLREYRTRLIADVVTGKLDVRAAAANLPEQSTEPEALSSEDDTDDDVMELAELENNDE